MWLGLCIGVFCGVWCWSRAGFRFQGILCDDLLEEDQIATRLSLRIMSLVGLVFVTCFFVLLCFHPCNRSKNLIVPWKPENDQQADSGPTRKAIRGSRTKAGLQGWLNYWFNHINSWDQVFFKIFKTFRNTVERHEEVPSVQTSTECHILNIG